MQSNLTFQLLSVLFKIINSNQLPYLTAIPLNLALAKLCTFSKSQVLIQSLSNYFVHLELFEFTFSKDTILDALVHRSSFFMFTMLNGKSILTDAAGNMISETKGNCATLVYLHTDKYKWQFLAGKHEVLLLTFNEDYFIHKCKTFSHFLPLITAYQSSTVPHLTLLHSSVAQSIFRSIKKWLIKNTDSFNKDIILNIFIEECLAKYHNGLITKKYDTNTLNKLKISEITVFIEAHYHEKDAFDLNRLASRVNISRSSLLRLVKTAFQMPLHAYIVKLRMTKAMTQLLTSNKTVKEIACEVGYTDPFHFSRVFKKFYNIPPSEVDRLSQ